MFVIILVRWRYFMPILVGYMNSNLLCVLRHILASLKK